MSVNPRRTRAVVIGLTLTLPLLGGCEAWRRQNGRSGPVDAERVLADPALNDPSFTRPEELNGFFRGGRDQGSWSTEARSIEKSLGVNR